MQLVVVDDVDDVVQETMVRALQHPPRGDLGAWLARVLRNVVRFRRRSDLRRQRRERVVAQRDTASADVEANRRGDAREPIDALQKLEAAERISQALRALPEPYRTILVQRYFLQRSFVGIADEQGIREDAARQRHKRGLDMLRLALAKCRGDGTGPLTRAQLATLFAPWIHSTDTVAVTTPLAKVLGACATLLSIMTMKSKVALTVAAVIAVAGLSAYALWDSSTPTPAANPGETPRANPVVVDITEPDMHPAEAEPKRSDVVDSAEDSNAPIATGIGVDVRVVWDDDGTPATAMQVYLTEYDRWTSASQHDHQAATGKNGIAEFRDLPETRYVVNGRFQPVQNVPQVVRVDATSLDGAPFEVRIQRGTTVVGRVVDPNGRGIAGATVLRAGWAASWPQEIGVTEANGTFEIVGLYGRIAMGARAPGFVQSVMRSMNLHEKTSDTLEIELRPAAVELKVKVVDSNGAPVAGARVAVGIFGRQTQPRRGSDGRDEHDMPAHTKTDAQGVAQLGGLPPGTWSLQAKATGFSGYSEEIEVFPTTRVGNDAGAIVREIRLPELIVIEGHVRDSNGSPFEHVYVGYGQHGNLVYGGTSTKADGSYRLTGAPAGSVRMHAQRKGLDRREVIQTAPGRTHHWDVEYAAERRVHGSIHWDDGKPVARASFSVWSIDAEPSWHTIDHAADDGRFVLETPGHVKSVRVQVRTGGTFYQVVHEGPLPAGNLDIVLGPNHKPTATIRGRIVGPDGTARGGADLWHTLSGQGNSSPIEVDAAGRFAHDVTPGNYRLLIEVAGLARARVVVNVAAEEDKDLGDITLEHPAAVRVTVDGAPDAEMTFWLTHVESERRSRLPIVNGSGSVGGLPGGRYRVQVCGNEIASESREVFLQATAGGGEPTDVRILARPARPLKITLAAPAGAPRVRRRVADIKIFDAGGQLAVQHRASVSTDDSVYTKFALAPGRYRLHAQEAGLSGETDIDIRTAGEEPKEVALELQPTK